MFRKLVSNISFSPGLLNDLTFYAKRLHAEESIRRTGMVFMTLALIVQSFAVISPPKPSLASGMNDIIFGGNSQQDVLDAWQNNTDAAGRRDIRNIYAQYNISYQNIANATSTSIHHSQGTNLFSTGRHKNTVNAALDKWVPIAGAVGGGIYERPLSIWGNKSFDAITGTNTVGQKFWILLDGCGNIVMEPNQDSSPNIEISKTLESPTTAAVGSIATYRILYKNSGNGIANDVTITDQLPVGLKYISSTSTLPTKQPIVNGNSISWQLDNFKSRLAPTAAFQWIRVEAEVLASLAGSAPVCNTARIEASNHGSISASDSSTGGCITASNPVCPGSGLPIPPNGIAGCTQRCWDNSIINYNQACPPQLTSGCKDDPSDIYSNSSDSYDIHQQTACIEYTTGCINPNEANLKPGSLTPAAEKHDESQCEYKAPACMTPGATNQVTNTNDYYSDPSLCDFPVLTSGCKDDPSDIYSNSSSTYDQHDQSDCVEYTYGCINPANDYVMVSSTTNADRHDESQCEYRTAACTDELAINTTDQDSANVYPSSELCEYRTPELVCHALGIVEIAAWNQRSYEATLTIEDGVVGAAINYYLNGELVETTPLASGTETHRISQTLPAGDHKLEAVLTATTGNVQPSSCAILMNLVEPVEKIPLIIESKTVSNTTQSLENASGTTANGGDELVFRISLSNTGTAAAVDQPLIDDIHDLLEYATVTDTGGGTYDEISRTIAWDPVNVAPNETVTKSFKVKILDPIPSTPISASDPLSYDMKIYNTFGNTVEIDLPIPTVKRVELATTQLPRTGPGTVITIGLAIFTMAGYMFSRSRLLAKEVDIIRAHEAAGGA